MSSLQRIESITRWFCIGCSVYVFGAPVPVVAQTDGTRSHHTMKLVDGIPRSKNADVVYLTNGEKFEGTVTNDRLSFHTSYGSVLLEIEWLAGITFDQQPGRLDRVKMVNRNRLTGFLNDSIEFQVASGETLRWNKHSIDRIVFRKRETESDHRSTGRFLVLENGDLLSGRVLNWTSPTQGGGNTPVGGLSDIELIRFAKGTLDVQVLLRTGKEISATLDDDTVLLELDLGPEVTLPLSHIRALYSRTGTLPPEVQREFASNRPTTIPISSEPPAPTPLGMVWIQPGRFQLGSYPSEKGHGPDEDPPTEVIITQGFWMGRHEVTQAEYQELTGVNPSGFQAETNHPVEKVTWNEATAYCAKRTALEREAGRLPAGYVYRLPTEAEWEYACRAGSSTRFYFGDDLTGVELANYAWFIDNSDSSTQPVGQLKPNDWGLHDMHGNVWEWCHDLWQDAYPGGTVSNYTGPTEGWLRVARGGSWLYEAAFCRSANRDSYGANNRSSDNGFRLVLARPLPRQ